MTIPKMTQEEPPDENLERHTPLRPILPWGQPTDEFQLFTGPLSFQNSTGSEIPAAPGRIQLLLRAGTHLNWAVDLDDLQEFDRRQWERAATTSGELHFEFMGSTVTLRAHALGAGYGFIPGSNYAAPNASIDHIVTHWVNLPDDPGGPQLLLREDTDDKLWYEWAGRKVVDVPPWEFTFDSRHDHADVYRQAKRSYRSVLTHTMEVRQQDGSQFSPDQARQVIEDLHVALSFPLGRWTAPVLSVGVDSDGAVVFSTWAPWLADTPGHDADRWWPQRKHRFFDHYLTAILSAMAMEHEREHLELLITSTIATGQGAFLEQRLATAIAAIEYLSWVNEVLNGPKTEKEWRDGGAVKRIRRLLGNAHISLTIDPTKSSALARFANSKDLMDAPAAIIRVRDHVTHPKHRQNVYGADSPLADAARLAARYLDLLILHRVDYRAFTRDRTIVTGWEGPSDRVPWVHTGAKSRTGG